MTRFEALFGCRPDAAARAPGRINLLGEHTDYNDGLVLPIAIPYEVTVELARSRDGIERFHSEQLGSDTPAADDSGANAGFGRYLRGCIEVLRQQGHEVPPLWIRVDSRVPIGAGLSSSAALEVAVLRAIRKLLTLPIDDVDLARSAHEAEQRYAGVRCGILDQMASSLADTDRMLYLDTRTLERRLLPLPTGAELCAIHSGTERALATSGYNQRRAECEQAAQLLGVESLRDVTDGDAVRRLPVPLNRRVRHIITENARVATAAAGVDAETFGRLMSESQASLQFDYEVSAPALDRLIALLSGNPAVFGAKLTGAGFGGACVALTRAGAAAEVATSVMATYRATFPAARVILPDH